VTTLLVVSGTGTEIGKTWLTARLIEELGRRGRTCAARKPVQSFDPAEGPSDAEVLGRASGEPPEVVTPRHRWYEVPVAPPMAAEILGRPPIALEDLVRETTVPEVDVVLVEGAGGPRSPLADDGDVVDLAEALDASHVLLVAEPGLGTINAVLLASAAFPQPPLVYLNRFDAAHDLHIRNRRWLEDVEGLEVCVTIDGLIDQLDRHPLEVQ
jgi:dethiobiotin synthetase